MLKNQPTTPILIQDLGMMYPIVKSKQKTRFGIYRCYCGNEFKSQTQSIKNGDTISCGCYRRQKILEAKTTHGLRKHMLYHTWADMILRCNNKLRKEYKNYGQRGITVCDRWLNIENFIEDMYHSHNKGLTLDRINNDGNYEPLNCRWASKNTQSRNSKIIRTTNKSGYRGVSFSKKQNKWISQISINYKNINFGAFDTAVEGGYAYDKYIIDNNLEHTTNGLIIR